MSTPMPLPLRTGVARPDPGRRAGHELARRQDRPDGAWRRRHLPPRIWPSAARHLRRPEPALGGHERRRDRVGLRRSAVADARKLGLRLRHAEAVRGRRAGQDHPARPGREDEQGALLQPRHGRHAPARPVEHLAAILSAAGAGRPRRSSARPLDAKYDLLPPAAFSQFQDASATSPAMARLITPIAGRS